MELFLSLLSGLLFLAVIGTVFQERWATINEERQDMVRRHEILELRERYVGKRPNDPFAWEMLGDAYKQADLTREALDAWEEAVRVNAGRIDVLSGDIGQKVRLAELALREEEDPASLRQTARTREQVCRRCGNLSAPDAEICDACGAPMLVDGIFDAARHPLLRAEVWSEARPWLTKLIALCLGTLLAAWMPIEVRATLAIATIVVVPFWMLRRFGQG